MCCSSPEIDSLRSSFLLNRKGAKTQRFAKEGTQIVMMIMRCYDFCYKNQFNHHNHNNQRSFSPSRLRDFAVKKSRERSEQIIQ